MAEDYKVCANCGKQFDVLRPDLWAYKAQHQYFCTWKCLREKEKKQKTTKGAAEMARKLTLEQKKKAVQIAIDGGNPGEYLKECGCDAPDQTWYYIRNKLKTSNPDLFAKIPSRKGKCKKASKKEKLPKVSENPKIQNKFEKLNEQKETAKAAEEQKELNKRYDDQLKHIHDAMMVQGGCEDILYLAQAEMIINKIKERRFD